MTGRDDVIVIENGDLIPYSKEYNKDAEVDLDNKDKNGSDIESENISNLDDKNKENPSPARTKAVIHIPTEAVICSKCNITETSSADLKCVDCLALLNDSSIPQLFAVMRQWSPGVQANLDLIVKEILSRGAHVDDVDGLTGMTLLHFACKSASEGVGNVEKAVSLVEYLIKAGASVRLRARWTDMLPLHYAAYFDCDKIVELLLKASGGSDIDARSSDFNQGTALHIAAGSLGLNATRALLEHGADPTLLNNKDRTALQCISEGTDHGLQVPASVVRELRDVLRNARPARKHEVLEEMGLSIGQMVMVGDKQGRLLFCGRTEFANGIWCGVELEEGAGKNDGSVAGVIYFKCKRGHGLFAPPSKISPVTGTRGSKRNSVCERVEKVNLVVGDRVSVIGYKTGVVQFIGKVKFSGGIWVGVELDRPYGKTDGSVNGVRYFTCKPQHGIISQCDKVKKLDKQDIKKNLDKKFFTISLDTNRAPLSSPIRIGNVSPTKSAGRLPTSPITSPCLPHKSPSSGRVVHNRSKTSLNKSVSNDTVYKTQIKLQPGMNAFVNGEIGIVKFIGRVDFTDGIWIGVALKNEVGKNDGTVQGKKYFHCKPGHGLMVKPNKVSVHGLNASKLISLTDYPE